jgi:CRP-like cAMP-binding protein
MHDAFIDLLERYMFHIRDDNIHLMVISFFLIFITELVRLIKGVPRNLTLKAGDYFGHEVMVDKQKYAATVVSLQTVTGWRIDRTVLAQTVPLDKLRRAKPM